MIIAIDGPAGSGKSTVAKLVAGKLAFHYLDTGAMYRSVAYRAISRGVSLDDTEALIAIARTEPISFEHEGTSVLPTKVLIGGEDVTAAIRTPQVDRAVSAVAACATVRDALVEQQRAIGEANDIVMEGRDIGTVVFPEAELKIFLTASPEERARRRAVQNAERHGTAVDKETVAQIHAEITERDHLDSTRETAPLVAADDAVRIDTSGLTIEAVTDRIAAIARARQI